MIERLRNTHRSNGLGSAKLRVRATNELTYAPEDPDLRQALIRSWARPGVSRQAADVEIPAIQRTRKRVRPMRPRGCRAGPRAAGTAAGTPCEPGSRHPDEVGK